MFVRSRIRVSSMAMVLAGALAGCGGGQNDELVYPSPEQTQPSKDDRSMFERWFGGSPSVNPSASTDLPDAAQLPDGKVGVNRYLWRASLDTLSFMPLGSADPFGGTIITDWYSAPETPSEQFKVTVYILGRELRADGVRVSVFRQERDAAGQWTNAPVQPNTATLLENAILTRARQLRVATVDQ